MPFNQCQWSCTEESVVCVWLGGEGREIGGGCMGWTCLCVVCVMCMDRYVLLVS